MTEQSSAALELSAVTYTYPKSQSGVNNISLAVSSGSIYGLLGINGAGKTTLMRLMIGLLQPQQGSVRCLGSDLNTEQRKKLASIGSLIEIPSVYQHLTGRQHLRIFAEYNCVSSASIESVLDLVGIADAGDRLVGQYSLGMKQRLALATALLHDPAILVLDEPTNGLDPVGIAGMRDLLNLLSRERGKTIVVSSHQLAEVQKMATHVGIVHNGKLQFQGTIDDLATASAGKRVLRLRVSSPAIAATVLKAYETIEDKEQGIIRVRITDEADAANVIRNLIQENVDVFETVREVNSLERDFLSFLEDNIDAR